MKQKYLIKIAVNCFMTFNKCACLVLTFREYIPVFKNLCIATGVYVCLYLYIGFLNSCDLYYIDNKVPVFHFINYRAR